MSVAWYRKVHDLVDHRVLTLVLRFIGLNSRIISCLERVTSVWMTRSQLKTAKGDCCGRVEASSGGKRSHAI